MEIPIGATYYEDADIGEVFDDYGVCGCGATRYIVEWNGNANYNAVICSANVVRLPRGEFANLRRSDDSRCEE